MTKRLSLPLLAIACLGAGCARGGDFPSLAPRAVEQLSLDEPVREAVDVPGDTGLLARIDALVGRAQLGQGAFQERWSAAEAAASRGGAAGSENWVAAQQALSRLEAARRETVGALSDLDALALERASRPTATEDQRALAAAVQLVSELARDQQRRIDTLKARLSRP